MNATFQHLFQDLFLYHSNSSENNTLDMNQDQEDSNMKRIMKVAQVFFLIIAFLGIFENFLSILALRKSKELRNPTTAFIVNLCVAHLIYCILIPITYLSPEWNQNETLCRWNSMAKYIVSIESASLMVGVTINRYICVVHPKYYQLLYSFKYRIVQITLTWLYSLTFSQLPFLEVLGTYGHEPGIKLCLILGPNGEIANDLIVITTVGFPTLAFILCYPRVFWVAHQATKRAQVSNLYATPLKLKAKSDKASIRGNNTSSQLDAREMKLLKVMLVIVASFIICYFPITYLTISGNQKKMPTFFLIARFGINLSNVINPIIYNAMSAEYRKAYIELFQCKKLWSTFSTSSTTNQQEPETLELNIM